MNPKRFLLIGGTVLIAIGLLGIAGLFGRISPAAFFHPPYWINWFHLGFGMFLLIAGSKGSPKQQATVTLGGAIVGVTIGLAGLLFGSMLAVRFNIPELADPSDHIAHLTVGLFALWGWLGRNATPSPLPISQRA